MSVKVLEGQVVAPKGMKVGIVAARFNEIIVNKLYGGAIDGLVRHGVDEGNITAAQTASARQKRFFSLFDQASISTSIFTGRFPVSSSLL